MGKVRIKTFGDEEAEKKDNISNTGSDNKEQFDFKEFKENVLKAIIDILFSCNC